MKPLNCPQCGSLIEKQSRHIKLVVCSHCSSTLFIEESIVEKRNIQSHIQDKVLLIQQSKRFYWRQQCYTALGFLQFEHEEGYRTEWWVIDQKDQMFWLTEDEESFFLTQDTPCNLQNLPVWESLQPNRQITIADKPWLVTEKRQLDYRGIQGALPDISGFQSTLKYTYLVADNAETLILIFTANRIICRQGYWLDAFEIEVQK